MFVDPKGTEHTDAMRKIDGYVSLFFNNGKTKTVSYKHQNKNSPEEYIECKVMVLLRMFTEKARYPKSIKFI
ncbi:MAG: hypothetical protein NZ853_05115 [Leptospiraceae bacterium]|nr:hypothetical protein [Leptospiraceae bacterium]